MNIAETTVPDSTQLNADDLISSPRTFTVKDVTKGTAEQPVNINLVEIPGRAYRPGKSMRRILLAAWGPDSASYAGRTMTLYNDPTVKWGGQEVGGIRISHLSHIDKPITVALTVTRGKKTPFIVQPLTIVDTSGRDWLTELTEAAGNLEAIEALGVAAKTASAKPQILAIIRQAYTDAKQPVSAPTSGTDA